MARFSALPQVIAVVVAGSRATKVADDRSDVDLYVYAHEDVPVEVRATIARSFSERAEIDNRFWEPGDEWLDGQTGIAVDVIYRSPAWIEEQLDRVLVRHEASVGYSTCFWHNVLWSTPLYDRDGWYHQLQTRASQPYPDALRRAVIAKNHPILRRIVSSYVQQIELAARRGDLVSVNHRVAALLASYFDIIFAVNRVPHPGEKRLVSFATRLCPKAPRDMEQQVANLLQAVSSPQSNTHVVTAAHALLDSLDELLLAEDLITPNGR